MEGEIPSIKSLVVLDGDGKRIAARHYKTDFHSIADELAFEKKLFDKTSRTNAKNEAEIIMFDNMVTVYRNSNDVWFYVVGCQSENELILVNALTALHDALSAGLRMILETDPNTIVNRVGMKGSDGGAAATGEAAFTEQSFKSLFASAQEQIARFR